MSKNTSHSSYAVPTYNIFQPSITSDITAFMVVQLLVSKMICILPERQNTDTS